MASRKQHLSLHQRSLVVDLKNQGKSYRQIQKETGLEPLLVWLAEDEKARPPVQSIAISSLM